MESLDITELYAQRLVLLLETGPQTNEYNSIILEEEDWEKIFDIALKNKKGSDTVDVDEVPNLHLSEETYKLPDIQEIYLP